MTKYLITPSLLESFVWYLSDESEDARQKFLNTLAKVRTETTSAQQRGIDFEEAVKLYCDFGGFRGINPIISHLEVLISLRDDKGMPLYTPPELPELNFKIGHLSPLNNFEIVIKEVAEIVKGGLWQESVKKEITVGNQEFLLYGRTDVIKRDTIYDIKFTSKYELGKFLNSSQHLIYLYCSGLPNFSYLISDGKDWWKEDYRNHAGVEDEIKSKVSGFLDYLENDKEAKEMFLSKWGSK